jgi:hypothetical protein
VCHPELRDGHRTRAALHELGKDERDFDKHIWQLPIPLYDPTDDLHSRLSVRGAELEAAIGKLNLEPGRHFAAVRRDIRGFIAESEAGRDAEELGDELLSRSPSARSARTLWVGATL